MKIHSNKINGIYQTKQVNDYKHIKDSCVYTQMHNSNGQTSSYAHGRVSICCLEVDKTQNPQTGIYKTTGRRHFNSCILQHRYQTRLINISNSLTTFSILQEKAFWQKSKANSKNKQVAEHQKKILLAQLRAPKRLYLFTLEK